MAFQQGLLALGRNNWQWEVSWTLIDQGTLFSAKVHSNLKSSELLGHMVSLRDET